MININVTNAKIPSTMATTKMLGLPMQQQRTAQQHPRFMLTPNHTIHVAKTPIKSLKSVFMMIEPIDILTVSSVLALQITVSKNMKKVATTPTSICRMHHCWKHSSCSANEVNLQGMNKARGLILLRDASAEATNSRKEFNHSFAKSKSKSKKVQRQSCWPHSFLNTAAMVLVNLGARQNSMKS
jgi:hypothetical protein